MKIFKISSFLAVFVSLLLPLLTPSNSHAQQCCSVYYEPIITAGQKPMKMIKSNGRNVCVIEECYKGLGTNVADIAICGAINLKMRLKIPNFDSYTNSAPSDCRNPNISAGDFGQACNIFTNQCIDMPKPISYSTDCTNADGSKTPGVNTAIGCIKTTPGGFGSQVMAVGIGVGSGLAFLFLIYGSYKFVTSSGNPEGIGQGKEIITSAIVGLIFIILSVSILFVVGVDILNLGSFGLGSR